MPCINLLALEPNNDERAVLDTKRAHNDPLIREVVTSFVSDRSPQVLDVLTRLITATDQVALANARRLIPLPVSDAQLALHNAIQNLYDDRAADFDRLKKARGVILEAVLQELLRGDYSNDDDVCLNNIKVGIRGSGAGLQALNMHATQRTVDVAAWKGSHHQAEFYECKLRIHDLTVEDLQPVQEAFDIYSTARQPRLLRAALCTLTPQEIIRELLRARPVPGSISYIKSQYPKIDFLSLSTLFSIS